MSGNYEVDEDTLRKIRIDLLENLNSERKQKGMPTFYIDLTTNNIAQYYSEYLINNDHNQDFYESA